MKSGARMIAKERKRQARRLGWTASHDDEHTDGILAVVAAELAAYSTDASVSDSANRLPDPWKLVNLNRFDRVRQLVIAGALIAAEIDRLKRAEKGGA